MVCTMSTLGGDQSDRAAISDSTVALPLGHSSVADDVAGDLIGQTWGDFRFIRPLGRGGMGVVYRGQQLSLERPVAIKVLPKVGVDVQSFRLRFLREAKAAAQISSPHVVPIFHYGEHQGSCFYVMELCEGQDLATRLAAGFRPTPVEALDLMIQAVRGLVAAGDLGLVHRDIKPANMIVSPQGHLKLLDFGLVRLLKGSDVMQTGRDVILGTPLYMSPEQAQGQISDVRSDIYAIGVTFFELLTGRPPFIGETPTAVMFQHIHQKPAFTRAEIGRVPRNYRRIVLTCLEKNSARRYPQARDLLTSLEHLHLREVARAQPGARLRLRTFFHPREFFAYFGRVLAWGLLAVLLLVVGLLVLVSTISSEVKQERTSFQIMTSYRKFAPAEITDSAVREFLLARARSTTPEVPDDQVNLPEGDEQQGNWFTTNDEETDIDDGVRAYVLDRGYTRLTSLQAASPSRRVYRMGRGWRSLGGFCLVESGSPAAASFIIRGDGKELWRSRTIGPGWLQHVALDISTIDELELIVETTAGKEGDQDGSAQQARAHWIHLGIQR